jgi:hypothetical protein
MLVLAMEFSRDAQRAFWTVNTNEQTGAGVQNARARGHRKHQMVNGGFASEGWNHPGLLIEQDPRVTPSKRNSDAQCQPQGPQASRTGHPKMCGPPGVGYG